MGGAEISSGTEVTQVLFKDGRAEGVRIAQSNLESCEVQAKIVVDASGGATLIGRQLGLRSAIPDLKKLRFGHIIKVVHALRESTLGKQPFFELPREAGSGIYRCPTMLLVSES